VPIVSGGGGGSSTAQVVASGKVLPVADAAGVTVDTTTYNDTIKGSGKLTTLVFPADQGALSIAVSGDAFPRWLLTSDGSDGLYFADGTVDPYASGAFLAQHKVGGVFTLQLPQVSPVDVITSGALPTQQLVTATGAQFAVSDPIPRDVETITPCTFNPGVATTATVTVALSPDNVTYSTLGIETVPVGVALDGTIHLVKVRVPAGWYIKLTVNAQAVLGLTTYY
jgi:hypothetical protein